MSSTRSTSAIAVANQAAAARVVTGAPGDDTSGPLLLGGSTAPVGSGEVPASALCDGVLASGAPATGLCGGVVAGSTSPNGEGSDVMSAASDLDHGSAPNHTAQFRHRDGVHDQAIEPVRSWFRREPALQSCTTLSRVSPGGSTKGSEVPREKTIPRTAGSARLGVLIWRYAQIAHRIPSLKISGVSGMDLA